MTFLCVDKMPDSPKCPSCFDKGVISQTYKVAGKAQFKCQRCGFMVQRSGLDERELQWKENFKNWVGMIEERLKDKPEKMQSDIRKQLKEIEQIVTKR